MCGFTFFFWRQKKKCNKEENRRLRSLATAGRFFPKVLQLASLRQSHFFTVKIFPPLHARSLRSDLAAGWFFTLCFARLCCFTSNVPAPLSMSPRTTSNVTPHLMRGPACTWQCSAYAWRQRRVYGFPLGGGNDRMSESGMTMKTSRE